ncbi:hypothetical protein BH09MYX1_BH09MYX1_48300 [soil metagenome]
MQGYPPPGGPPPGGYGGAPPPGGYGPPPGAYGAPPSQGMMQPNAPFGIEPTTGLPYSDKSKMVAGLLQIFLGPFGAGRFYTGHTGLALAPIAVVWCTCGLGALWPLIDDIMMLTGKVPDAEGRPLRDG